MHTTRGLLPVALACCLMFSACFTDSDHAAYVPTASVSGYISQGDAAALTGYSAMPEFTHAFATSEMSLNETDTGVTVNIARSFGAAEEMEPYELFSELTYRYDDNGRISSFALGTADEVFDDIDLVYRITDNVMVRKTIFDERDGSEFIGHIITAAPEVDDEYDVSLITVYWFTEAQAITDPDHDVSDGTVVNLCREYRDDGGRLIRQVFYDTDNPEEADETVISIVYLYQYDDHGRLTGSMRFSFDDGFAGGDFADLDENHVSFEWKNRFLYDGLGNLRYLVRSSDELGYLLMAITWELNRLSAEAAAFLHDEVRWIDMHPFYSYEDRGLIPLLYPILII